MRKPLDINSPTIDQDILDMFSECEVNKWYIDAKQFLLYKNVNVDNEQLYRLIANAIIDKDFDKVKGVQKALDEHRVHLYFTQSI